MAGLIVAPNIVLRTFEPCLPSVAWKAKGGTSERRPLLKKCINKLLRIKRPEVLDLLADSDILQRYIQ